MAYLLNHGVRNILGSCRPFLLGLTAVCCLQGLAAAAQPTRFHSGASGYSIAVPHGWVRIPAAAVKKYAYAQFSDGFKANIFDAAFQTETARHWFGYPFVLIRAIPYSRLGMHRQMYTSEMEKFIERLKRAGNRASEVGSKHAVHPPSVSSISLDRSRHVYAETTYMTTARVGRVRGRVTGYFGRNELVQIIFLAPSVEWDKYRRVRRQFRDSFRFDSADAYQFAGSSPLWRWWPEVVAGMAGIVVLLMLRALFRQDDPSS